MKGLGVKLFLMYSQLLIASDIAVSVAVSRAHEPYADRLIMGAWNSRFAPYAVGMFPQPPRNRFLKPNTRESVLTQHLSSCSSKPMRCVPWEGWVIVSISDGLHVEVSLTPR